MLRILLALIGFASCACLPEPPRVPHPPGSCGSPVFSAAITVTNTSPNTETSNSPSHWSTPMARVGDLLTIIYFVETKGGAHTRVRHRVLNLNTGAFTAADSVDTFGVVGADTSNDHNRPSLVRDAAGNILAVTRSASDLAAACPTTDNRACVRAGLLALDTDHLIARFNPDTAAGPVMYDIGTLWDPLTNCSYLFGEAGNIAAWPWAATDGTDPALGLGRLFWRICGGLATTASPPYEGPYQPIEGNTGILPADTGAFDFSGPGNIFNKGRMVLGVDKPTLHWLTTRNNSFTVCDIPGTDARYANCPTTQGGEFNADLYYIRSADRGRNWSNLAGTVSASVTTRIADANASYRIYQGEIKNNTENGWDIGPDDDLYVALMEHDGDVNDLIVGRPDWDLGSSTGTGFNLRCMRVSKSGTVSTTTIENQPGPDVPYSRLELFTGAYGEVVILRELPLEYRRSMNHCAGPWTGWTSIAGSSGSTDRNVAIYRDPLTRGAVHLLYGDLTVGASMFYRKLGMMR